MQEKLEKISLLKHRRGLLIAISFFAIHLNKIKLKFVLFDKPAAH